MLTKVARIDAPSPRSKFLFISALAALLLGAVGSRLSADPPADHMCDPDAHWGYDGFKGPLYWGTDCTPGGEGEDGHDESYAICLDGVAQSPISATSLGKQETLAQVPIGPADATATAKVANNGHAIELGSLKKDGEPIAGNTELVFEGTTYKLKQLHFHCPSEHRLWANGTYQPFNPMEMHLVHKSDRGTVAVVAVFFSVGTADNPELQKVLNNVDSGQDISVALSALLPPANSRSAWIYYGSLTTPSCKQVVNWFVMKQSISASSGQISRFRDYYSNNSRGASLEQVAGGLKQISAGESGVWGVNSNNNVYARDGMNADNLRGTNWVAPFTGTSFIQVSSGSHGLWLVSPAHVVNFASSENGDGPKPIPSPTPNITQVSAGKYGVWARDTAGGVFYRTGVNELTPAGKKWERFTTPYLIGDISSGEFGVWAVEKYPKNNLYFLRDSMTGTLEKPAGSIFTKVDSNISRVSSGFLGVWALEAGGPTSQVTKSRSGITADNPAGAGWRVQDGFLNEITNGKTGVWGTNQNNYIYFLSSPPTK